MSNILKLIKFNLFVTKKTIIGWSIAIFLIMGMYMILFDSIQDIVKAEMEAMPEELLQFFGVNNLTDMSNYITYFGTILGILIIAISIFAVTYSASLITKEEKTKSIEFLSGLPISRKEIFISKYLTSLIAIIFIVLLAGLSATISGYIKGGDTFNIGDLLNIILITGFIPIFFGGVGIMIAGINSKIATGSMVSIITLISYMLGYLTELLKDKAEWLKYLSPFILFSPSNALELSNSTVITFIIYIILYIVLIIVGLKIYKKRDMKV